MREVGTADSQSCGALEEYMVQVRHRDGDLFAPNHPVSLSFHWDIDPGLLPPAMEYPKSEVQSGQQR